MSVDDDLFEESSSTTETNEDKVTFVGNHRIDGEYCEYCGYAHENFSEIQGFVEAIQRVNQKSPHELDKFLTNLQSQIDTVPTMLAANSTRNAEAGMIAGSQHGSLKAMRAILTKLVGEEEMRNAERFFEVEARLLFLHFVHATQVNEALSIEEAEKKAAEGSSVLSQLYVVDAVQKKIIERNLELLTDEYKKLAEEYGYEIDPKILESGTTSHQTDGLSQLLPLLYALNHHHA